MAKPKPRRTAASKAGSSQAKSKRAANGKATQFKPNDPVTGEKDPRINRAGRIMPKEQKELNALLDELFSEVVTDSEGHSMEKLRVALNRMLLGKNVAGIIHLLERRYGKVPLKIEGAGESGEHLIRWVDETKKADDADG